MTDDPDAIVLPLYRAYCLATARVEALEATITALTEPRICRACGPLHAHGLCQRHYDQLRHEIVADIIANDTATATMGATE